MPWSESSGGNSLSPSFTFESERSLGFFRSGASAIGLSYGQFQIPAGTAALPGIGIASSESSLGFYRSAASTIALSYGSLVVTQFEATSFVGIGVPTNGTNILEISGNARFQGGTRTLAFNNTAQEIALTQSAGNPSQFVFNAPVNGPDGSAIAPSHVFASEVSLGLYRSGVSTVALSYGTMDLTAGGAVTSIASLKIKSGVNNSCGTAVLGSNGSVNVANTYVKTGDLIFLTDQTAGGTLGDLELGGIRNSSGFTILSTSVTDTSTVAYLIIRPG